MLFLKKNSWKYFFLNTIFEKMSFHVSIKKKCGVGRVTEWRDRPSDRRTDGQTSKQIHRQIGRQTDIKIGRQIDR